MAQEQKREQTMRYSNQELQIIKNTFAENDDLLKTIRKVMLQMPLNAVDLSRLELIKKKEVLAILRKTFLPTLDADAPINQQLDLWMTVQIVDKTSDEAYPHLKAREMVIDYIDQQLYMLEEGCKVPYGKEKIKFSKLVNLERVDTKVYIDMITRNTIVNHIEMQLMMLKILGGLKDETLEETQERLKKDSAK